MEVEVLVPPQRGDGPHSPNLEQFDMQAKGLVAAALIAMLTAPVIARAEGTVRGAQEGAEEGGRAAGPLGAIVGGTVGAATGTVGGILGVDDRPASANMSFVSGGLRIVTPRRSELAQYYRKAA